MSRTQGPLQADMPQPDGLIPLFPGQDIIQIPVAAETSAMHKIAAGEYSLRTASASDAYEFVGSVSKAIYRCGMQDDLQEFFGSAQAGGAMGLAVGHRTTLATASITAGAGVSVTVDSTVGFSAGSRVLVDTVASGVQEICVIQSITSATAMVLVNVVNAHAAVFPISQNIFTTPAGVSGRPPYAGMSQLTPVTAPRPKGISFKQIYISYIVNTTAITVPTCAMYATTYAYGTAPVVTTLIASGTNGLQTAASTTPYVIPVPVPVANQGYITLPNTFVTIEFDFTSGASGTVDILGMEATCSFNYN
jgi:hypothetical protein